MGILYDISTVNYATCTISFFFDKNTAKIQENVRRAQTYYTSLIGGHLLMMMVVMTMSAAAILDRLAGLQAAVLSFFFQFDGDVADSMLRKFRADHAL